MRRRRRAGGQSTPQSEPTAGTPPPRRPTSASPDSLPPDRDRFRDPFEGPVPLPAVPTDAGEAPSLSVVVIVYAMADQALRTVQSMCVPYQQGVEVDDYEIVVVENNSDAMLDGAAVESLGPNVRYLRRHEEQPTPVPAVNHGVAASRGRHVGLVVDGARMASPGLVATTLAALALSDRVAVVVPGYHLGDQLQQRAAAHGYDERAEAALLDGISWPADGYKLFDISVWSGTSKSGFYRPSAESNFLALPRTLWDELGGMDPGFDEVGGGFANLDLYRRVLDDPEVLPVLLHGEGTFHQFHGGATTGGTVDDEREAIVEASRRQYLELRGSPYAPPRRRFVYFGALAPNVVPFVHLSTSRLQPEPTSPSTAPTETR